ncbi:hypothetical protein [Erwinia mallotivora]|uniref:hypothetical protein n=1 Tax=Erwinia mallotivora TaxID=69222 RepID=UPI0021C062D7|nr:hypothetical protein [Erwinia mallotivora]
MAKHISKIDEVNIINIIKTWSDDEKLTWDFLCDSLTDIVGKRPTRQSLSSHPLIAESFNEKKLKIKRGEKEVIKPANLIIASKRIKRLQAEVETLTKINNQLLEQFVVWQYNALLYQITPEMLSQQLADKK